MALSSSPGRLFPSVGYGDGSTGKRLPQGDDRPDRPGDDPRRAPTRPGHMTAGPGAERVDRMSGGLDRRTLVVGGVATLGLIMAVLDTTIVNVALDTLSRDMHAPLSTIQWVSTGYLLSLAAVIPLSGWITERFLHVGGRAGAAGHRSRRRAPARRARGPAAEHVRRRRDRRCHADDRASPTKGRATKLLTRGVRRGRAGHTPCTEGSTYAMAALAGVAIGHWR